MTNEIPTVRTPAEIGAILTGPRINGANRIRLVDDDPPGAEDLPKDGVWYDTPSRYRFRKRLGGFEARVFDAGGRFEISVLDIAHEKPVSDAHEADFDAAMKLAHRMLVDACLRLQYSPKPPGAA